MTDFNPAILDSITGFLLPDEARLLYRLAAEVPENSVIVEIGSYQGKSTVALGLSAKQSGAVVYAIDPHFDYQDGSACFGMRDQAALFRNLLTFEVAEIVRVVTLPSWEAHLRWNVLHDDIAFAWIDGRHTYNSINEDLHMWSQNALKMACHDYANPDFPDVARAVDDFVVQGKWKITERVDTIAVLERA